MIMRTGELAAVAAIDVFGFGLVAHEGGLLGREGASVLNCKIGEATAGIKCAAPLCPTDITPFGSPVIGGQESRGGEAIRIAATGVTSPSGEAGRGA